MGTIGVEGRGEVVHNGIALVIDGTVNMQLSAKSVGLFEAFYNSVKPISLISSTVEVAKPGKLPRLANKSLFDFFNFFISNMTNNFCQNISIHLPYLSKQ